MSRVIPQNQVTKESRPAWMDGSALVQVSGVSLNSPLQAIASAHKAESIVISYACTNCNKVHLTDSQALKSQANLAERSGEEVNYSCPKCSSALTPNQTIERIAREVDNRHSAAYALEPDLSKEAGRTYNTFVDQHIVYKAVESLTHFAASKGMAMPQVKFLRAEHDTDPGRTFSSLNKLACEISWAWGIQKNHLQRRGRVFASVSIDPAGKILFPRIFTTAAGTEHPFESHVISDLESKSVFQHEVTMKPKATDTSTFRRPDPSRFRSFAALENSVEGDESIEADLLSEANMAPSAMNTPITNTNTTPAQVNHGDNLVDPGTGNVYNVQDSDANPNNGLDAVNEQTQETGVIPASDVHKFKPAISTGSKTSAKVMADRIISELVGISKKKVKQAHVATMSKDWNASRANLSKVAKNVKPDVNESGHDKKTNIPISEKKDITVGMTEFPFGEDRDKESDKGYGLPYKEMEENQVATREHFDNENRLPIDNMMRKELHEYMEGPEKDQELGLNQEELEAVAAAVGMTPVIAEDIQEGPVQFKSLKKKSPIIDEPAVIDGAKGKVSEAITKFKKVQEEIDAAKVALQAAAKPVQETLAQVQKPFQEDIVKKSATMKSYLDMIFDQLSATDDKIAAYQEQLYAAAIREKDATPKASLAEILELADTIPGEAGTLIRELQAIVEEGRIKTMLERFLYEYPVSDMHKTKKVNASEEDVSVLDTITNELASWLQQFMGVRQQLETVAV